MAEIMQDVKASGAKASRKKQRIHIDMTPMVDLAFLLLTFFVLTATFQRPSALSLSFPAGESKGKANGVTVVLCPNHLVYWYSGSFKGRAKMHQTSLNNKGLLPLMLQWNKPARERLEKALNANQQLDEKAMDAILCSDDAPVVLVKVVDETDFQSVITTIDYLNISSIKRFSITDLSTQEKELLHEPQKLSSYVKR